MLYDTFLINFKTLTGCQNYEMEVSKITKEIEK